MFKKATTLCSKSILGAVLGLGLLSNAQAVPVTITIENLTPEFGLFLTPLWVGIHDGSFNLFDLGGTASAGLELLAEEGVAIGLISGGVDGIAVDSTGVPGPLPPGGMASATLEVDPAVNRFLSYASMVIPSNDAFIGNADAIELFDANGVFNGLTSIILGTSVWDAGTEVNNGIGAAFSQIGGVGTPENNGIAQHPGLGDLLGTQNEANFPVGTPPTFPEADFTAADFQVVRITVTGAAAIPEPGMLTMMFLGLGMSAVWLRRRKNG